jgi:two-component system response regulator (stage 0 sporulation protein A)
MAKIRVLIAEDHEDFARLLRENLSVYPDIEVTGIACDGEQTVSMAEKTRPDVLLLDLMLPGMDGIEALEVLREKGMAPKTIVISAIGNDEAIIRRAMELGAQRFFVKPFEISSLACAISDLF